MEVSLWSLHIKNRIIVAGRGSNGGGRSRSFSSRGRQTNLSFCQIFPKISRNSIFGASGAAIGRSATGSGLSRFTIITACNSSCGKVMFSQV